MESVDATKIPGSVELSDPAAWFWLIFIAGILAAIFS